jgi:hypothetical protein
VRTLLLLLLAASVLRVSAQSSSPRELDISGAAPWTDTGVGLKAGDTLKLSATGTLRFAGARDAIVPGARYPGAARADHLAVALPFDKMAGGEVQKFMDHVRYPRAALLESLVRFVVSDLETK